MKCELEKWLGSTSKIPVLQGGEDVKGIEWLRRHLGEGFRIHEVPSLCRQPMHIDSTFMPLAPGKVLVNPDYIDVERLPPIFKTWDVLVAPRPDPVEGIMSRIPYAARGRASTCSCWTRRRWSSTRPSRP